MKTLKIFFLISFLGSTYINGQSFCSTASNDPDFLQNISMQFQNNIGPYTIRVYAHFIRRNDGTGGITTAEFNTALQVLSDDLSSHNICISLKGKEDINNTTYYDGSLFTNFVTINNINNQADAIDIYFHPNTSPSPGGKASSIPSSSLSVGGTWTEGAIIVNTSHILSHEFGHCLGLYHTHHQIPDEGGCPDCADGTNCTTCGDFVCDTPPDPHLLFNSSCNYTGGGSDICGFPYNPNESIIMSYTGPNCMQYYSIGEGQRMRDYIENNIILQAATIPNNVFVQNKNFDLSTSVLYAARTSVTAGENVTTGTIGQVKFTLGSVGEFKSRDYIKLEAGFEAFPNSTGVFYAWIDPLFCSVFAQNNARVANDNSTEIPSGDFDFNIFPNPNEGRFSINLGKENLNSKIIIYNLIGEQMAEYFNVNDKLDIDISSFSKGIYTIKSLDIDGSRNRIIIKN